ncbi:hypothetical protein [Sodalis glossinidius]|uniref:hypothetical protein n=1 Tax=Sodalis glossinidius TaxID=63612 RepID=UPI0002F84554|nr:hypothetical protein [Sodalis glossinidius]
MQGLQPATRATVQLLQNMLRLVVAVVQMLSSLLTASLAAVSQNAPAQALPGLTQAAVTTTEPELVTLYRITGDARDTARFIRRNRLRHPLFVPGGERVELLGG